MTFFEFLMKYSSIQNSVFVSFISSHLRVTRKFLLSSSISPKINVFVEFFAITFPSHLLMIVCMRATSSREENGLAT